MPSSPSFLHYPLHIRLYIGVRVKNQQSLLVPKREGETNSFAPKTSPAPQSVTELLSQNCHRCTPDLPTNNVQIALKTWSVHQRRRYVAEAQELYDEPK